MSTELTELDKKMLQVAQEGIHDAFRKVLVDAYDSPMKRAAADVLNKHGDEIKQLMDDAFSKVVLTPEFQQTVLQEFEHKLAKSLVAAMEGTVAHAVNTLKSDPTIRARMILALETIIKEARSKT